MRQGNLGRPCRSVYVCPKSEFKTRRLLYVRCSIFFVAVAVSTLFCVVCRHFLCLHICRSFKAISLVEKMGLGVFNQCFNLKFNLI